MYYYRSNTTISAARLRLREERAMIEEAYEDFLNICIIETINAETGDPVTIICNDWDLTWDECGYDPTLTGEA